MVCICIPTIIGLWSASERWIMFRPCFSLHVISGTNTRQFPVKTFFFVCPTLKFGDKNCLIFGEDLFFWSSLDLPRSMLNVWHFWLFDSREKIVVEIYTPILKIWQNWGKIANYSAQHKSAPLITPKRPRSWRGWSLRHCTSTAQLISKKFHSGGKPLATLCAIWLTWDLNLRSPASETNTLPLD